jgi:hypothetical protein
MATASMESPSADVRIRRLGVRRLVLAGGLTAAVVYVLCWIGMFIPFSSPTHAYVGLFTAAEARSALALAEGTLWSLLFGALVGGLFALIYNATAPLDRN